MEDSPSETQNVTKTEERGSKLTRVKGAVSWTFLIDVLTTILNPNLKVLL